MRRISLRKLSGKVLVATVAAGMAFATMVASPVQAQAADQGYPTGDEGCVAAQSWTAPDPATFADNQNKSGYPGKLRWDKGKRVAFYWPDSVDSAVKSSKVDDAKLQVAADHLERLIDLYTNHDGLDFPGPSCMLSAKYKVIIVLNNNGGYYGGTVRYKNSWDKKKMYPSFQMPAQAMTDYWGMAHELMHSFQMGPNAYGAYDYDGTNTTWLWESHANWMAFQANGKNNLHCTELGINNPSKLYGSGRDRYCNWTFMEYLAETQLQGVKLMTDMWTKATKFPEYSAMERPENPLQILRLSMGKTQAEFNDLFGEWAMHNVTWDYPGKTTAGTQTVGDVMRKTYGGVENANVAGGRYVRTNRLTYLDPVDGKANRYKVLPSQAPAQGGYNTIKLLPKAGATSITVDFHGIVQATSAAASWPSGSAYPDRPKESPNAYKPNSGWRWGVVAVDANGNPRYSEIQSSTDGRLTVPVKAGDKGVYLVVVGAPTVMHRALWDQRDYSIYRYPYFVDLKDATAMDMAATVAGKSGWTRHTNPDGTKGGWVKNGAKVAATAYIAPGARVFAGTISGNARIEDHATILNGTVTDNAVVKGISVMINANSKIYGNAVIDTTFQAIDYFRAVKIGGTAQVHGVTEYNTGKDVTAGVYSGGVWDGQTTGYLSKLTSYDEVTRTPTRADYLADRPIADTDDGWIERDAIKTSVGGAASWSPEGGKLNDGVLVDSTWPTGDGGNVNAKVWGTYGVAAAKTYAQYDWAGAHTVDSSRVQFWSDHAKEAASGLEKPKSWKIQYLDADGKTWKDVTPVAGGAYTTVRNSGASRATDAAKGWSTVTFAPVRTKSLRLVATPAADANVGIAVAEWGVHQAARSSDASLKSLKVAGQSVPLGDAASAAGASLTVDDPAAVTGAQVQADPSDSAAHATIKVDAKTNVVTVTVTAGDGTAKTYKVTLVRKAIAVTGVTVAGLSGPLAFGASAKLTATVTPANTTGDRTVTWSSSDASVASVAADGTVTGLKAGKATITATSRSAAAVKGSLEVTVAADAGNVAPSATVSASYTNKWLTKEPLRKVTDGAVAYANTPDATWNNYGDTTGAEPWLQLAWTRPQSLTGAKVFLWTDNGGVPKLTADKAWRLQAQAGDGTWKDVALRSGSSYGVDYAAGNAVEFASPVRASALRVVFPKGAVTGVSEVEAFGAADPDTVRPVIKGAADVSLDYGAAFDAKAGVTASDDRDGDLTSGIVVSGDAVDTRKAGVYTLTYSVADKAGNTASVTRRVTVRPQSVAPDLRPGAGNVAPDATVSASYTNKTLSNGGADAPKRINDGVARFGADANVAWNSWRDDAAADETWVQLAWKQRMDLTRAGLYFWTDNGGVPLPGSWRLQYADASGAWRDVALAAGSAYGAKAGVANEVSFDKVSTDRLRVVFPRVEKNFGVGVTEFAAYGAKSAEKPVGTKASSVTVLGRRSLEVGDSVKLAARVAPAGVDDPSVSWSSSDTSVATVDAAGRVRALRGGTVRIVATARDGSGVSGSLSVTVAAADAAGPVVSGAADAVVSLGSPFDALGGVAARDDRDGDLTSHVLVSGSVNTDRAGSYTLTYTVADRAGNKATVTRTITVR